ncbi:hypothetical protein QYE76_057606 [Lolium multiflorum]|uniref:Uncharacterized protein n=1 Tax=Lolium multiflorum TaxID=4521 RepID=A0AAD8T3P4_LOLMU|nr:hypothetical protein QYE76_057606 [Lolium multiflorum]
MAFFSCIAVSPTLVVVTAFILTIMSTASGSRVPVAINGEAGGEATDQCVHGCVGEMLACQASAGCAAVTASVSSPRKMIMSQRQLPGPCGSGCENEYLGCIDVC